MKGLTIVKRTSKQEGTIRLRFRLRDGRGVDLYHKSEIDAELKDLDKFTDTGELKPRVSVEIAKKRDRLNTENGNAIKSGMANLLTSAMHHPKTLIGQTLLHQTIVNYKKIFPNKIIKVSLFDITI